MSVDFGRTAEDYAAYRSGFPTELFVRLRAMGIGLSGQRVVDLGTGTGALARGFAQAGCSVTGVDPAAALLAQARRLDIEAGVTITYQVGRAEETGLRSGGWDVVSAGQCWHWFDRQRAAREASRLRFCPIFCVRSRAIDPAVAGKGRHDDQHAEGLLRARLFA